MEDRIKSVKAAKKISALFVDLDETLWQGTIALEERVVLYQDRYEIIKFLHDLGIQIFIVSRNDEAEVEKTFNVLGIDKNLFTHVLANWDSKPQNIKRLLEVTDIKPETAVFIDDNEALLDEAKHLIPGLHILAPGDLTVIKESAGVMCRSKEIISESQARKNRYRLKIQERFNRSSFQGSDVEFQKSLKKKICVDIPPSDNLYRIIKLLFTTHRLNFNPYQFDSEEILVEKVFLKLNKGQIIYAVSASQGEISLGLIGAFIVDIDGKTANIENATFSCSSMGLGFEQKALLVLIKKLKNQGVLELFLNLSSSSTNARIQKILWEMGFELNGQSSEKNGTANYLFLLNLKDFKARDNFSWIKVSDKLSLDYPGMPDVIDFFYREVAPIIEKNNCIVNLGSARGEVLGLLEQNRRDAFNETLKKVDARLSNVDLEFIPEENNLVADAEDLSELFTANETQDHVWAIELLEHTYHPWKVINEMTRICKIGGYLFITVPGKSFPKHEYPVDLWRIGPEALLKIFSPKFFLPIAFKNIGPDHNLRRTMAVFKKIAKTPKEFVKPFKADSFAGGSFNQDNGIIYFD